MYRYFNLLLELANVLKILIYFFTVILISTIFKGGYRITKNQQN